MASNPSPPEAELFEHNWYHVLEIQEGCSLEVINKAGKKQSLAYHPDKNKAEDAPAKFLLVQKAKDALQDPEKKKKFDDWLEGQRKRQRYDEDKTKSMDERRKRMKEELENKIKNASMSASKSSTSTFSTSDVTNSSSSNRTHHSIQKQYTKAELDKFKHDAARLREEATAAAQARENRKTPSSSSYSNLGTEKEIIDEVDLHSSNHNSDFTEIKVKNRNHSFQSELSLFNQFKPYGRILNAKIVGDKGNSGIISYKNHQAALMAVQAYEFSKDFKVNIFSDGKSSKYNSISSINNSSNSNSSSSNPSSDGAAPFFSKFNLTDTERFLQRERLLKSLEQEEYGDFSSSCSSSKFSSSISEVRGGEQDIKNSSSNNSNSNSNSIDVHNKNSSCSGSSNYSSTTTTTTTTNNNNNNSGNVNSNTLQTERNSSTIDSNNKLSFVAQESEILLKMKKLKELAALRKAQANSN